MSTAPPVPGLRGNQLQSSFSRQLLVRTIGIASVYPVVAFLTWTLLSKGSGSSVSFWPVAGMGVAVVIAWGRSAWAGLMAGAFCTTFIMLWVGQGFVGHDTLLLIAAVNAVAVLLQCSAASYFIQRTGGFSLALTLDWKIVRMLFMAGPVAATIAATVNSLFLLGVDVIQVDQVLPAWVQWWAGDAMGILMVTPLTLSILGLPEDAWTGGRRRKLALPVAVAILLMVGGMHGIVRVEEREARLNHDRLVSSIAQYARSRAHGYLDMLAYMKALFDSSDSVSRTEFQGFASVLLQDRRDVRALEWIPLVTASERTVLENSAGGGDLPAFRITEFDHERQLTAAAAREQYFPIEFIEPMSGNEAAYGFDLGSFPQVRAAILRARDEGSPVATPARTLIQQPADTLGVIIYTAIYSTAVPPDTLEARRLGFRGVVAIVLHVGEFMEALAARFALQDLQIQFVDADRDGSGRVLYRIPGYIPAHMAGSAGNGIRVPMGGRIWELRMVPLPSLFARELSHVDISLLLAEVFGSLMLSAWFLSISSRQVQMETAVADRTAQLRKTLRAVENNPSMIMITDGDGIVEYVNPRFVQVTGFTAHEVTGRPAVAFLPDRGVAIRDLVRIRRHVHEQGNWRGDVRALTRSGDAIWIEAHVSPLRDAMDRITHYVVNLEDVSERRKLVEQLSHQAHFDALTGLMNRLELERNLERVIMAAHVDNSHHALCFLDLDQFKVVNDTCGHVAGDELLRQVAALLRSHVRRTDSLARFGGDEFALVMENCPLYQAQRVAEQILAAIEKFRFTWESKTFSIGASIGVVPVDESTSNLTEALQKVDAACYAAKDAGRGRVHVYRPDDSELARRQGEMQWVAEINRAVERDLFCLYAQPIVPIAGEPSVASHFELLVRMKRDDNTLAQPGNFLGAAERYNLSRKIDRWVVSHALNWLSQQIRIHGTGPMLSINLSGSSFSDTAFRDFVFDEIRAANVPPTLVCFELTETAAIANLTDALNFIEALRNFGCRFALDDFGSGLSSFAYLKNFPIDYLKIDGFFVKNIDTDPIDVAMVRSINDVGHEMGKQTIAEYVENDRILAVLRDIGVDFGQGYGIGRPQPLETVVPGRFPA